MKGFSVVLISTLALPAMAQSITPVSRANLAAIQQTEVAPSPPSADRAVYTLSAREQVIQIYGDAVRNAHTACAYGQAAQSFREMSVNAPSIPTRMVVERVESVQTPNDCKGIGLIIFTGSPGALAAASFRMRDMLSARPDLKFGQTFFTHTDRTELQSEIFIQPVTPNLGRSVNQSDTTWHRMPYQEGEHWSEVYSWYGCLVRVEMDRKGLSIMFTGYPQNGPPTVQDVRIRDGRKQVIGGQPDLYDSSHCGLPVLHKLPEHVRSLFGGIYGVK